MQCLWFCIPTPAGAYVSKYFLLISFVALGTFLQTEVCVHLYCSMANHMGICFPCFCPTICCAPYPFEIQIYFNLIS